jgi:guanylate kinase
MSKISKGKLIVVSGPAGCGKDTIVEGLFRKNSELFYSISTTTRMIREGETDGKHYFYTTREEFERLIELGEFLEYTKYCGNYYGTRKATVMTALEQGKNILLKIEGEGARNVKAMFADAVLIFIQPPSLVELRRRLESRNTEDQETIERRLMKAEEEIANSFDYDYRVINDDLQTAINEIAEILRNEA